jgi:hypothetical protein
VRECVHIIADDYIYICMYVPEGRISDRSLSCRCLAGNPVTPGSVRRTRRPTIKEDERGKKREAWNRKENKEGDNVDKIKTKQTNKTHKVKSTGFTSLLQLSVCQKKNSHSHYFIHSPLRKVPNANDHVCDRCIC